MVQDEWLLLDLSDTNRSLQSVDLKVQEAFENYINGEIANTGKLGGYGGYLENRALYRRSDHFDAEEPRSLHLGIDFWAPAGTQVYAPIAGRVHSFQNNHGFGDYGPTIILEHSINDASIYSLYGHLSEDSLTGLFFGKPIAAGEPLARFGTYSENGSWPPHLHFQVMNNMLNNTGDFPGVAPASEKAFWSSICPNPSILAWQG